MDVSDPRRVQASEIDVLHIHWPEKVFWDGGLLPRVIARLVATTVAIQRLKQAGVSVVWTVHNLKPHDLDFHYKPLWHFYLSRLCEMSDGFVTLCPSTVQVVRREIKGLRHKPAIYAWHPVYPRPMIPLQPEAFKEELQIDQGDYVFGFLGMIRPYKGLEELIQAFRKIDSGRHKLLIAGAPVHKRFADKLSHLAAGDRRIQLIFRNLSEEEFFAFGSAVDVLVLPFRDSLHSGSLVHAVSHHRVTLTPESPFSTSLRQTVGGEWVQTYSPPLTPDILTSAKSAEGAPLLDALARSESGRRLAEFYCRLVKQRRDGMEPEIAAERNIGKCA